MLWFFPIPFIEACQGHWVFAKSQWNRKSGEDRTWKWCPTLLLTINGLELSHTPHLISREAGEWSESASPERKGIQFEKLLLHLLTVAWTWLLVVSPGQWMSAYVSAFCSVLPRGTYLDAQESGYVLVLGSQGVELLGTWWAPSFSKMSPWSVRFGLHFSCWYYMTRSSWPQLVDIGLDTQTAKKILSFGNLKLDQRLSLGGWLSSNLLQPCGWKPSTPCREGPGGTWALAFPWLVAHGFLGLGDLYYQVILCLSCLNWWLFLATKIILISKGI